MPQNKRKSLSIYWVTLTVLVSLMALDPRRHAIAGPVGNVFSGVTAADAAVPYWNAGAMTLLKGTHILLTNTFSFLAATYKPTAINSFTGRKYPNVTMRPLGFSPTFGIVTDAGLEDFRFGLTVSIPWGEGAEWPEAVNGEASITKYYGISPRIGQLFIGPAVAYRINKYVSIGVGIDIAGMLIKNQFQLDFGAQANRIICEAAQGRQGSCPLNAPFQREDPALNGKGQGSGLAFDVGGFAGILVTPMPMLRLGMSVHTNTGQTVIPGTFRAVVPQAAAQFLSKNAPSVGPLVFEGKGQFIYQTPLILTAGVGYLPNDRMEFGFDFHFVETSVTTSTSILIQESNSPLLDQFPNIADRTNGYRLSLRGSYRWSPRLKLGTRLEYISNARPKETVNPTTFDVHKLSLAGAGLYKINRWLGLYLEYGFTIGFKRTIRFSRFGPNPDATTFEEKALDKPSPTGTLSAFAHQLGFGVTLDFE